LYLNVKIEMAHSDRPGIFSTFLYVYLESVSL